MEPRIYVKEHGTENLVFGNLTDEQKHVLINFVDRGEAPEGFSGFPGWGVACDVARKQLNAPEE